MWTVEIPFLDGIDLFWAAVALGAGMVAGLAMILAERHAKKPMLGKKRRAGFPIPDYAHYGPPLGGAVPVLVPADAAPTIVAGTVPAAAPAARRLIADGVYEVVG
jgi:hypothetical protein